MARIETKNYYTVEEIAKMFHRSVSTIKSWIRYGDFSEKDVLVFEGNTYVKKTAVNEFKNRIIN